MKIHDYRLSSNVNSYLFSWQTIERVYYQAYQRKESTNCGRVLESARGDPF